MNHMASYSLDNGVKYNVVLPKNIDENTRVIVYSCGWGEGYDEDLMNSISNSDVNAVVIVPNSNWLPGEQYGDAVSKMVESVKKTYSIETEGYISNGFSQLAHTAIKEKINYIEEHPDCERQLILLNDGVPITKASDGNYYDMLSAEDIAVLEKNNAFIIDYCQNDYINSNGYMQTTWKNVSNSLLNSNLDILFISDEKMNSNNFWSNHNYIYRNSYDSGLYRAVLSFVYEGGDLPSSGFIYRYYDHQTGQLQTYTAAEIKEKLNLSLSDFRGLQQGYVVDAYVKRLRGIANIDLFATLKDHDLIDSNLEYVKTLVDGVMNNIKKYASNLESCLISNFEFSTTQVPSCIPSNLQKYSLYNTDLVYKLISLLESMVNVSLKYYNIDQKLSSDAKDIEPSTNDYKEPVASHKPNVPLGNDKNKEANRNDYKEPTVLPVGPSSVPRTFLSATELHSDDNKIVFDSGKNYKVVIYNDDDKVSGLEYYYTFDNEEEAKVACEHLKKEYLDVENSSIANIEHKDNTLRVIYKEEAINNVTIEQIKEKYKDFDEVLMF